jgi:hypothetical protein
MGMLPVPVGEPGDTPRMGAIGRVVSGGQTGVDRAALDTALALGLPYGGWCPRGGWAEDLTTPPGLLERYPGLLATPDSNPAQRTRWNVRDSDATLILVLRGLPAAGSGTALTLTLAEQMERPHAVVDLGASGAPNAAAALLGRLPPAGALNVAGPRESTAPGVYERARGLLMELLASVGAA